MALLQSSVAIDVFVLGCAIALPVLVGVGMWGEVGSKFPAKLWFPWHPFLMTLAFPALMTMGRWSYVTAIDFSLSIRRQLHRGLMLLAVIAAIIGYVGIAKAHAPKAQFFGYNFIDHTWSVRTRVAHTWIGYLLLVAMLAQAIMGMAKLHVIGQGQRIFTFHGMLGKVILALTCVEMCLAIRFWEWSVSLKAPMYALTVVLAILGVFMPRQAVKADSEEKPILASETA
mmetsp:Transcript_100548/g.215489  ORF Transcript_100548/g.215489 Transcript_100548/m.215489 type:complete len:228 (-) Transcript_100548:185-868(-)